MSTTVTSPAWFLPGAIHSPGLAAWNVAVAAARTADPGDLAGRRVDAARNVAGDDDRVRPACALIASIAPRAGSRGSPAKPVPRIASTIAAAPCQRLGSERTRRLARAAARGWSARRPAAPRARRAGARRRRGPARAAAARPPARRRRCCPCRRRPRPGLPGRASRHSSARPAPARSISSIPGIPLLVDRPLVVARCCSASGSGSNQSVDEVTARQLRRARRR